MTEENNTQASEEVLSTGTTVESPEVTEEASAPVTPVLADVHPYVVVDSKTNFIGEIVAKSNNINLSHLEEELDAEWHKLVYTGQKSAAAVLAWIESKINSGKI